MKVLALYDYPPAPGGLATQGDLLYKGLLSLGVDAHAVHFESAQEKEWYYRWFKPDIVSRNWLLGAYATFDTASSKIRCAAGSLACGRWLYRQLYGCIE